MRVKKKRKKDEHCNQSEIVQKEKHTLPYLLSLGLQTLKIVGDIFQLLLQLSAFAIYRAAVLILEEAEKKGAQGKGKT